MFLGGEVPSGRPISQTGPITAPKGEPIILERSTAEMIDDLRPRKPDEYFLVSINQLPEGTTLVPWGPYSSDEAVSLQAPQTGQADLGGPKLTCLPPARVLVQPKTFDEYTTHVFGGYGMLYGGKYFALGLVEAVDELLPIDEIYDSLFESPILHAYGRIQEGVITVMLAILLVKAAPVAGTAFMVLGIGVGTVSFMEGYVDAQSRNPATQENGIRLGQEGAFTALFSGALLGSVHGTKAFAAMRAAQGAPGTSGLANAAALLCLVDDPLHVKNGIRALWRQTTR